MCSRKRVCDSRNSSRAKLAECSKLLDTVVGGRRPAGGLPGHAAGGGLRGESGMDVGAGTVRHVDVQRRALLHGVNSTFGCHRFGQVNQYYMEAYTVEQCLVLEL